MYQNDDRSKERNWEGDMHRRPGKMNEGRSYCQRSAALKQAPQKEQLQPSLKCFQVATLCMAIDIVRSLVATFFNHTNQILMIFFIIH